MDFSLFHLPTYRDGFAANLHTFFEELTESVRLADRLGWARAMTTEHHFHYYGGAVPNPAIILAAWARETKRIRLGTAVSLLPLRHPLQVAEDYAMVDHLSGGRFDLGISRGFVPHEFEAFGVSRDDTVERLTESISIIQRFWQGEPFSHEGRFYRFARIEPWPRTLQREIPIWVAASNDLAGFERIGTGGFRLMMNQYPMSFESLEERHDTYKIAFTNAGHDAKRRQSTVAFMTYLADTEDAAIATARGPLQEHVGALRKVQQHQEWDRNYAGDESLLQALAEGGDLRTVFRKRTLICTPAQAVERIARYAALGFTEAIFICRFGALTHAQCCTTMERLTREVRPGVV
ncbi:MAG: LLM class flavin-dependent oxidoreductase [Betaproteobacteria bacterium]|nr:LLM class flavin-dependent oxidoreductase [Betaproteobacteria bacterium]